MQIDDFLTEEKWRKVDTLITPARPRQNAPTADLSLTDASRAYLNAPPYAGSIYQHQHRALDLFLQGHNVCLSTGTASGKSLVFQVAAVEKLAADPQARVIAIYPMKALASEQEQRWRGVLRASGLDASVVRIDGSVKIPQRLSMLESARVVIMTPDIIHAWLLFYLQETAVQEFLQNTSLIIVDEVHTYTGVFGSNSAFLFRRLRHLMHLLGQEPAFIAASATIADPVAHLKHLLGVPFKLIDQTMDTSPKQEITIDLLNPPPGANTLTAITKLLAHLTLHTNARFVTFVDSRVQVEQISSILARMQREMEAEDDEADEVEEGEYEASDDADDDEEFDLEDEDEEDEIQEEVDEYKTETAYLSQLNVLPYRAGYEAKDRDRIQKRLSQGILSGVISTSALELGIDIPALDTCILIGVPASATSLQQRIGRIGRHGPGHVLVINSGSLYDRAVFDQPQTLLERPFTQSALYLENEYIQYIHALCLARTDGEHDKLSVTENTEDADFSSPVAWPVGFLELCAKERIGEISQEFQSWKIDAGERPNHVFPLRDVESQFKIVKGDRFRGKINVGSLSHSQVLREAYPGAVYFHLTRPYRVVKVNEPAREVRVHRSKRYTTKPNLLPPGVYPNLMPESVYTSVMRGGVLLIECRLQIQQRITGLKERRGRKETSYDYPITGGVSGAMKNVYFEQRVFSRYSFTTGVILSHPVLNEEGVNIGKLADLFFEAFLMVFPFERQDVGVGVDKYRKSSGDLIQKNGRFIAIFDQTYGSLRLSRKLIEGSSPDVLEQTLHLAHSQPDLDLTEATRRALDTLLSDSYESETQLRFRNDNVMEAAGEDESRERIILPGSRGLNLARHNEEFWIADVLPGREGLRYKGQTAHQHDSGSTALQFAYIREIEEIPGVSEIGYYNYDTGEIEEAAEESPIEIEAVTQPAPQQPEASSKKKTVDLNRLRHVLVSHFSVRDLQALAQYLNVDFDALAGQTFTQKAHAFTVEMADRQQAHRLLLEAKRLYEWRQSRAR